MQFTYSLSNAIAISIGATLGAWIRWGLGLTLNQLLPQLPAGTLLANLVGGLLMGIVLALISTGALENQTFKLFITTGFLGGLTTFSAFTGESLALLQKHEFLWFFMHISCHVFGALLLALLGYSLIHYLRT